MSPRTVGERVVYECELCGAREGEEAAVKELHLRLEARARGLEPLVYPLVEVLERLPGLRVREAGGGSVEDRIPPYVYFHLEDREGALRHLEQILASLEMSHRRTRFLWAIETHHHGGELRFALRPRFMKPIADVAPEEFRGAQEDVPLLAERLSRDMGLSWWR